MDTQYASATRPANINKNTVSFISILTQHDWMFLFFNTDVHNIIILRFIR